MTSPIFTIAHLGCGGRGLDHIQAIRQASPRLQFLSLCDGDAARLEQGASLCPPEVGLYQDASVMLREKRPDIFSFVTQPPTRMSLVRLAIENGVKAVVMEKPMALSLAEARSIRALAKEAGIQLIVSHQHKYGRHWQCVKTLIDDGELGNVRTIHMSSKGWMAYYATHLIDYGLWLAGSPNVLKATGHASGWHPDETHPSPEYFFGELFLSNGIRLLIECGPDGPDQPQHEEMTNEFWMNAGGTVVGTTGMANVVVGLGWSAVTANAGLLGSKEFSFNGSADTVGLYLELADNLAAGTDTHCCRAEVALLGYESLIAICQSALNRQMITLPLGEDSDTLNRLRSLLSQPAKP